MRLGEVKDRTAYKPVLGVFDAVHEVTLNNVEDDVIGTRQRCNDMACHRPRYVRREACLIQIGRWSDTSSRMNSERKTYRSESFDSQAVSRISKKAKVGASAHIAVKSRANQRLDDYLPKQLEHRGIIDFSLILFISHICKLAEKR